MSRRIQIPDCGMEKNLIIRMLEKAKSSDVDWRRGRTWSLVYYAGDEHTDFLKEVYGRYFNENGASPYAFPSLRTLETEVVSMLIGLLGGSGDETGTMTSGGTESILLAVKAYRDWMRAKRPDVCRPEILMPESGHPAFLKAAHYLGLRPVLVSLDDQYRVDLDQLRQRISDQTICMVASAPSLTQGVVDPVPQMAEIAQSHGIGLHVDACLGSFTLPFLKRLGYNVPDFDFRVPGVTSISADLHKNGYAAKGASAVLYRGRELRKYQFYVNTEWPGGVYSSTTMMGTRPGGAIAAAWASMMALGQNGYLDLVRRSKEATQALLDGIARVPELYILGTPLTNVFSFSARELDIFSIGDRLEHRGWRLNRHTKPKSLLMIVMPSYHAPVIESFLSDLQAVVDEENADPSAQNNHRMAMLYGGVIDLGAEDIEQSALRQLDETYSI